MGFEIKKSIFNLGETRIDNIFIEEYMPHAPAEYVKIYIIALSKAQNAQAHHIMDVARALETSLLKVLEAFEYWREKKLVEIIEDNGVEQKSIKRCEEIKNHEKIKIVFKNIKDIHILNNMQDADYEPQEPHYISQDLNYEGLTKILAEEPTGNDQSFTKFIEKLEYMRKGKILSPEAIRRLAFYKNNLGLSVELLELACNLSYDNPNVKEYNYLNYARGILNNFYEANIFTIEEYYRRERQNSYKIPTPEEIEQQQMSKKYSAYSKGNQFKYKDHSKEKDRNVAYKNRQGKYEENDMRYESTQVQAQAQEQTDKINSRIEAQRLRIREKLNQNHR